MANRKTPSPDSAFTVGGKAPQVLRPSELQQRKESLAATTPWHNPWGRQDNLYTGDELKTNPGIPPERMAAYGLPSRVGGRLHYPDGRVEVFPDTERKLK